MWDASDGARVWWGREGCDIEDFLLDRIDDPGMVYAACSGPDTGLAYVHSANSSSQTATVTAGGTVAAEASAASEGDGCQVAGAKSWRVADRKAFGISLSLYEQNPITQKLSGEPIADTYAVCTRKNSAILVIADGVNWGEKSKLAARCAVYGAMDYLNCQLCSNASAFRTTQDAFANLREAMTVAHKTIVDRDGGLTTFCAAVILPASRQTSQDSSGSSSSSGCALGPANPHDSQGGARRYAVCTINVGDSLAFVFSRRTGLREVTIGSHDLQQARDVRDAGGALGLVDGCLPALDNLTFSLTFVDEGDIVFLTTDGVTDNFDPVVTKLAAAAAAAAAHRQGECGTSCADSGGVAGDARHSELEHAQQPLVMLPHERHLLAVKSMEMSVHEFELGRGRGSCGGKDVSAFELCMALMQRVVQLTDGKRKVIEDSALYRRPPGTKLSRKERQDAEAEIRRQLSQCPGKLDHATVVAYEVGECQEPARAAASSAQSILSDSAVVAGAASVAMRRYLTAAPPVGSAYEAGINSIIKLIPAHN